MNDTPLSLQIISWIYMALGLLIASIGLFAFLAPALWPHAVKNISSAAGLVLTIVFGGVGVFAIFVAKGLMTKSKFSWYFTFIGAAFLLLSSLKFLPLSIFVAIWTVFVLWKLFEHRKLFGIRMPGENTLWELLI